MQNFDVSTPSFCSTFRTSACERMGFDFGVKAIGLFYAAFFDMRKIVGTLYLMESFLLNYSGYILSGIAALVWLIRLEGRTNAIEKASDETQNDLNDLRIRHEGLDTKIVEQLAKVRESLARLEGYFSAAVRPLKKNED